MRSFSESCERIRLKFCKIYIFLLNQKQNSFKENLYAEVLMQTSSTIDAHKI